MAEAFFRKYAPDNYEDISAGTHHISQINPIVVQAMNQVGIDISNQKAKEMTEDMIRSAKKLSTWDAWIRISTLQYLFTM
jgi:arsenate reductase (thioredoxin)